MSAKHSTSRLPPEKPRKPHKDFPLSWHPSGYWCKKIRGKLHYFGARRADPQTALDEYLRVKDDLLAGRAPRPNPDGFTVRDAINHFLTDRKHRMDAGQLTQRSFDRYEETCARVARAFGRRKLVAELTTSEFLDYLSKISKKWNPVTIANEVQRVRSIFKYAYDAGLIEVPVRFGPTFKRPSNRVLRRARQKKGERLFTPENIHSLLEEASPQLKTMILLAINCGFGNSDCARLPLSAVNLETGWVNYPRPKTGIDRRCLLWPETVAAIQTVLESLKQPKQREHQGLFFITKYGLPWFKEKPDDPITKEFRKLLNTLGIYRPGLSFYALRHTFETIAGDSRDQVAVDHIMGHARDDMASVYRERINDQRLVDVVQFVHDWLYRPEEKEDAEQASASEADSSA